MDEKQLWSEVQKVVKKCDRRARRASSRPPKASGGPDQSQEEIPPLSTSSRQKKYDVFMLAVEDIMRRQHEVNMDITLRGDMARAFHITMAIGRYLWNKDDEVMVQKIMQAGVEQIISQYNSEVVLKEARRVFKPILKELLKEMEDDEVE